MPSMHRSPSVLLGIRRRVQGAVLYKDLGDGRCSNRIRRSAYLERAVQQDDERADSKSSGLAVDELERGAGLNPNDVRISRDAVIGNGVLDADDVGGRRQSRGIPRRCRRPVPGTNASNRRAGGEVRDMVIRRMNDLRRHIMQKSIGNFVKTAITEIAERIVDLIYVDSEGST